LRFLDQLVFLGQLVLKRVARSLGGKPLFAFARQFFANGGGCACGFLPGVGLAGECFLQRSRFGVVAGCGRGSRSSDETWPRLLRIKSGEARYRGDG
jgi:hypothetical protein